MWVLGEINVAEEHFATATTRLVMANYTPEPFVAHRMAGTGRRSRCRQPT